MREGSNSINIQAKNSLVQSSDGACLRSSTNILTFDQSRLSSLRRSSIKITRSARIDYCTSDNPNVLVYHAPLRTRLFAGSEYGSEHKLALDLGQEDRMPHGRSGGDLFEQGVIVYCLLMLLHQFT